MRKESKTPPRTVSKRPRPKPDRAAGDTDHIGLSSCCCHCVSFMFSE